MLEPKELYGCQGFPSDYIIDHDYTGKSYPRSEQVKRCGNAVCPPLPAALVKANLPEMCVALSLIHILAEAEHLGNLKKDLLMLRNLTIIDSAHKEIKKRYGKTIPLWTDEILNDKDALSLIAAGKTDGIFQLESEGMKKFMKDLKPSCFEDIIAGVSLYRPGPMDFIPQYIEGKQHPENITYLTPQLEPIPVSYTHLIKKQYGRILL